MKHLDIDDAIDNIASFGNDLKEIFTGSKDEPTAPIETPSTSTPTPTALSTATPTVTSTPGPPTATSTRVVPLEYYYTPTPTTFPVPEPVLPESGGVLDLETGEEFEDEK